MPTTKSLDEREREKSVINRSSLHGLQLLQFLVDWYAWEKLTLSSAPGITHVITRTNKLDKLEAADSPLGTEVYIRLRR